jgi:HPt (histidine-containing phosphotransfer) domain-containing protein
MSGPVLIDHAVVDDLVEAIGAEGARSVIELFVAESRTYLAAIAEAAAPGSDAANRERARRAAHSLKSGAGQIGAAAVAAAAAEVERAASADSGLSEAVTALAHCAAATNDELAHFPRKK